MIKEEKVRQVEELAQGAAGSGAVVFADYSGLTVTEMSELRKKLSEIGANFLVVKNTLIGLALKKAGLDSESLEGPTAVLLTLSADPIESIKILVSYLKEKAKGEVKFGFFEKSLMVAAGIADLALIPGKAVLQARLVSQLSAPIYKLAYVLSAQQQKLVMVLDAISKSKGGVSNG